MAYLVMAMGLWLVVSRTLGQYSAGSGRNALGDVALTMVMIAGVVVPIAIVSLILPRFGATLHPGRAVLALLPTALLWRLCTVGLRLWRSRPGFDVLVVGIGPLGRLTGEAIREAQGRAHLLGHLRFDDEIEREPLNAPMLGTIQGLEETLRQCPVDEVYFASSATEHTASVQAAIHTCETLGVPFALPVCGYRLDRARLAGGGGLAGGYSHFLNVHARPLHLAMKRFFDILLSATALALLSPLLVAVALVVKSTSRGPVLFRQQRVGLHGRMFHMLKFRSMVKSAQALQEKLTGDNEQSGPVFKIRNDPRVTAVGRFLRKHSIDELPQIVNVLRGDMSIVGPRPAIPGEVARYEAWQLRRLSVRPGLTCVWQVSGRNEIGFLEWMRLDMQYIDRWSFAGDLGLILRTIPVVLTGRGAS
jgi:exopolysaccharide biosynthesis polyprenyl glycosylphosphotransferase